MLKSELDDSHVAWLLTFACVVERFWLFNKYCQNMLENKSFVPVTKTGQI